jgi:hypothetical protein
MPFRAGMTLPSRKPGFAAFADLPGGGFFLSAPDSISFPGDFG